MSGGPWSVASASVAQSRLRICGHRNLATIAATSRRRAIRHIGIPFLRRQHRRGHERRLNMTKKTILITGAGSGFGKGAAIGMAKNGHNIIATTQVSSQVTPLREEAAALGLENFRVERLDLTDPYDIAQAQKWDIDVLWNNAGMGEAGPVCEIPVDLVR
jgi:FlaA1/EpsC-like NDP-sugar epimerase